MLNQLNSELRFRISCRYSQYSLHLSLCIKFLFFLDFPTLLVKNDKQPKKMSSENRHVQQAKRKSKKKLKKFNRRKRKTLIFLITRRICHWIGMESRFHTGCISCMGLTPHLAVKSVEIKCIKGRRLFSVTLQ